MFHKILFLLCLGVVYIFDAYGENRIDALVPKPDEFTHQVSIRVDDEHFCGGTILDKYTILTTVSCLEGRLFNPLTVVAGTKNLKSGGDTYKSVFKITHSDYDKLTGNNNVAVIKVSTPIKFNEYVTAASLPETYTNYDKGIVVTGWGWKTPTSDISEELLYLNLKTLHLENCNTTLHEHHFVTNKHMCVNPCLTGLIWTGDNANVLLDGDVVVGVTTWLSSVQCNLTKPDLYTNIHMYVDWISQHLSPL